MTENKVAVDVFQDRKDDPAARVNQETPQSNQEPVNQPQDMTPETQKQEATSTTQVIAQDDSAAAQNTLSISLPWIAAGIVVITILLALLVIIRRLNRK